MVFYLKYRPKTLDELDNQEVATLMAKYLARASIPHAFLFTGPKGIGKTSTARILAKSINCTNTKKKGLACGKCEACISIATGNNLDVLEIDAASNRGIDEIRDLREKIKLSPTNLAFKVYIIDEVHMLTTEAFNALLKTLEEPPLHAVFILATTEISKVPDTITSRCVWVEFHKATGDEIVHSLKRIVRGESLDIEEGVLEEIARAADGAFRDAAKYLEEVAQEKKITLAAVKKRMGRVESAEVAEFLECLKNKQAKEMLALVGKFDEEGKNVKQFFWEVLRQLEKLLVAYFSQKEDWRVVDLVEAIKLFSRSFVELKSAVIPTLPFELAIVEFCEGVQNQMPKEAVAVNSVSEISTKAQVAASVAPLVARWSEFLENLKPLNHSIAGVLRSCRPLTLNNNTLVLEAAYKFHAERLGEVRARDIIAQVIKQMLGIEVKVETVLRKR